MALKLTLILFLSLFLVGRVASAAFNKDDPHIQDLAEEALIQHNQKAKDNLELDHVLCGYQFGDQFEKHYAITFSTKNGGFYQAEVIDQGIESDWQVKWFRKVRKPCR